MLDMCIQLFLYPFIKYKGVQSYLKIKSSNEKLKSVISLFYKIIKDSDYLGQFYSQFIYILMLKYDGIISLTKKYIEYNTLIYKALQLSGIRQYAKYYNGITDRIKKLHQDQKEDPYKDNRKDKIYKNQNFDVEQQKNEAPISQIPKANHPKQKHQALKNQADLSISSPYNLLNQNQREKLITHAALPPIPKQQSPFRRIEDDHLKSSPPKRLVKTHQGQRSFSQQDLPTQLDLKPMHKIDLQNIIETQQPGDENLIQKKSDKFKTQRTSYQKKDIFIGKISEKYKSREGLGLWKSKESKSSSKFILGQWKNDEVQGLGYSEFKTGKIQFFMGEYKDSQPSQGYMRDQNGAQFYGSFYNGQPNGKGMFIFPNKDYTYKGGFRDGKFHGRGELLDMVKQRTIIGVWKQGAIQHIQDSQFFLGYDLRDSVAQKEMQQKKKAQAQRKDKEKQYLQKHMPTKQIFNQDLKKYEVLKKQNPKMFQQILRDRNIDRQMANKSLIKQVYDFLLFRSCTPTQSSNKQQIQAKERKLQIINGQLAFLN